jgi:AcrR family transcriptional regulator
MRRSIAAATGGEGTPKTAMARSADPQLVERRRRQILDAAMQCFRKRGFHKTSMQEICCEAALSAGALYRYFPSKSDIIFAIAEEEQRVSEPLFAAIATGADMIDGVCALAAHMVAKCSIEAPLFAEVMAETLRDPELSRRFAAHEMSVYERLVAAMTAAWRRAPAPDMTPDRAARLVLLLIDGLAMRTLREASPGAGNSAALLDDFRQALERLLAPAPATRRRALAGADA